MGRLIYKIIFFIFKCICHFRYGDHFFLWYRNSILSNYFKFGKSDLDVTVFFTRDSDLLKAKSIKHCLQRCPLIKEINFYCPSTLGIQSKIKNPIEIQKDPRLKKRLSLNSIVTKTEGQQAAYLLRMFFANRINLKNDLNLPKWQFHFRYSGIHAFSVELFECLNHEDLLSLILISTKLEGKYYKDAIKSLIEVLELKTPLHIFWEETNYKHELMIAMPHMFCFAGYKPIFKNENEEAVFLAQISWELSGLLTQPELFLSDHNCLEHFKRLKRLLNHIENSNYSLALSNTIEEIIAFRDKLNFPELN